MDRYMETNRYKYPYSILFFFIKQKFTSEAITTLQCHCTIHCGCFLTGSSPFFLSLFLPIRMDIWANHAAYAEVLKEDEEWAERRKEYNLDMYPRHIWQDNVSVNNSNATFSLEEPWPGTNTEPIKPKKGAFDRAKEMVQNAFRK